jgi:GNAT superfamily N-acetyltransferase
MKTINDLRISPARSSGKKYEILGKILERNVTAVQSRVLGPNKLRTLAVVVRDPKGHLVGGLFGITLRGWLIIELLYLDRKYRHRGVGSEFMRRAEALAKDRGCCWSHVETGDGQAPRFYPKFGYRCVYRQRFYRGLRGYAFTKRLSGRHAGKGALEGQALVKGVKIETCFNSLKRHDRLLTAVGKRINAYTRQKTGPVWLKMMAIEARDRNGRLVGGFTGATWWNWFQPHRLWVASPFRRKGLGSRLMREAESEARRRGSVHSMVKLYDFQAPLFRDRMGYRIVSKIPDFPKGHQRYVMVKELGRTHS